MEALESLFSSRVRLAVLRILFSQPDERFYGRELARLSGERQSAVWRELQNLEQIGLVRRAEEANVTYFQVQRSYPLFAELRALLLKGLAPSDDTEPQSAAANGPPPAAPRKSAPTPAKQDIIFGETD